MALPLRDFPTWDFGHSSKDPSQTEAVIRDDNLAISYVRPMPKVLVRRRFLFLARTDMCKNSEGAGYVDHFFKKAH